MEWKVAYTSHLQEAKQGSTTFAKKAKGMHTATATTSRIRYSPLLMILSYAAVSSSAATFIQFTRNRFQTSLAFDVTENEGPLSPEKLAAFWGEEPLLIRNGFNVNHLFEIDAWPSWETVTQIACEEDANARVIQHIPGDLSSFSLDIGPFDEEKLTGLQGAWTLVVNDVDRFHPPLAEWIDQEFSFVPRWRRDDGQISLAPKSGGIGPHVDNYDVFLIQTTGEREWIIGKEKISVQEEMETLMEGIDVRIIKDWDKRESTSIVVKPGDVLYLPPRVAHCGIALTDDSMTLSVGCRTPSASDLISRVAERLTGSVSPSAVRRFEDLNLLRTDPKNYNTGEITLDAKLQLKKMVTDAMNDFMEHDDQWDSLVGEILTESTRPRELYPLPLADANKGWIEELGVWADPKSAVETVLSGNGSFFRAEGVAFAYTKGKGGMKLFANGESFCIQSNKESTERAVIAIIHESELSAVSLNNDEDIVTLLETLVARGLIYGSAEA